MYQAKHIFGERTEREKAKNIRNKSQTIQM